MYIILGTLAGGAVGFTMAMRMSKKFNKRVRESVFFQKSILAKNPVIRKSLAMPPLEELESLFNAASEDASESYALTGKSDHNRYT